VAPTEDLEASIWLILTVVTIVKWDCHGLISLRPVLDERETSYFGKIEIRQ
jgi:hypothetical protein